MKQLHLLSALVFSFFIISCSAPIPAPVKVESTDKTIDYIADVKPILDKRCVSCHSCYNSPCQAKFSSFEGVDRGGTKALAYDATRLSAIDPTRLFIDAQNTKQWREKGYFSLTQDTDSNASYNDSIMIHMLNDKMKNPEIIGLYDAENDERICPRDSKEMGKYLKEKPNHGMPYGFPALKDGEFKTLSQWLLQGAKGPTAKQQKAITSPSAAAAVQIEKWESFLNAPDDKHAMTARYLYEHYFLAHINFKTGPREFYSLVRSKTPSPQEIELIPTLRPFEDPGTKTFYYRFSRIHSTIVHKTHMVVEFDDTELARINELFIEPQWVEEPHRMGYESKASANPFVLYFQIPVRSRYQFLLDHNNYIVMTFIRGPVCRGQMALNVIHDHFWVMFQDPDHELSVKRPSFLLHQSENLSMPIVEREQSVLRTFNDDYRDKYQAYYKAKEALYDKVYPQGLGVEGIWKGNTAKDSPLLTVYRHFNSASVHRGVIGELPRTMWVMDYPQFERIYYALVAGYDIYGNVSHQTNIRRYMDFLRMEGEVNFLAYMPKEKRLPMTKSWYIGDSDVQNLEELETKRDTGFNYKTPYPKSEFIEKVVNGHILKSTGIAFDNTNYYKAGDIRPKMPTTFNTLKDINDGARSLTAPGTGFIKTIVDRNVNIMKVRIIMPNKESKVFSIVINRWHDNVNSLFGEDDRLDSSKDTMDFIPGSIGSYPNVFGIIHYEDLPDFYDLLANYKKNETYNAKVKKYLISRSNEKFWETYDWFQNNFNESEPLQAGLYNLNRYYPEGW